MRFIRSLSILTLIRTALADIEFTFPSYGYVLQADKAITAEWRYFNDTDRIIDLVSYDLYLCAGGDSPGPYEEIQALIKKAPFSANGSASFNVSPTVGGREPNAYFLKMIATGPETSIIGISGHFTLIYMTGAFSPDVLSGTRPFLESRDDNDNRGLQKRQAGVGPGGIGADAAAAAAMATTSTITSAIISAVAIATTTITMTTATTAMSIATTPTTTTTTVTAAREIVNEFTIPYQFQTGHTRYAPAPKKPGTSITTKAASRQYPTSPYSIATTYLSSPAVYTTVTAPVTYHTSSIENTASPAPLPDARMQRFLDRWKD